MIRPKLQCLALTVGLLVPSMMAQQPATSEPADLQVQFRSVSGSNRVRIGEVIPVEVLLSSTAPNRYLEPCALFRESNFGFPQCRFSSRWSFTITPETGWVDYTKEFGGPQTWGGPMFDVPPQYLTTQAVAFSYILTHRFRFDKPGEYEIHLSLDVGFDDETTRVSAHSLGTTVTREITLQIVPAEPEWQKGIVRKGAEAWFSPSPGETNPPSQTLLEYRQAKRALCTLGTPEAARVLAKAILPSDFEAQNCLERSPSLSDGIEEMQRLLVDPDVAVSPNFFSALVGFLNIRESKKVGGLYLSQDIVNKERDVLFNVLPQKRGAAQAESLATVLRNPIRTELDGGGRAYDLPFPPQVISVAVENFDRLPAQMQELLLGDGWDRIRSPLMLRTVRQRAEAGDGPALLRWRELEPVAANEFIRKEIVRPQPRFSSHYLRLADALLPAQEKQIAANFAAFAMLNDDRDLVHSATLVYRYATVAVLPTVLPFIDAKLTEWPCSIQVPVLAYLLKVSPERAAPRVEKVLGSSRTEVCTNRFLTTLGLLEPGAVLQRIAFAQVEAGTPAADDGALYLARHAPPELKATIWQELEKWQHRVVSSGAEKRWNNGGATTDDGAKHDLVMELTTAFESAQEWVLTQEEEKQLETLLDQETMKGLRCRFQCGGSLSVGPGPRHFTIIGNLNPTVEERDNVSESMEYLNSTERLRYRINQYGCADLQTLKDKLLQFPAGSIFNFNPADFSERDRNELVEISHFLSEHNYKVDVQDWPFLASNTSH
ncbi:MAG: hypothetical protein WB421_21850 [Terriglobales bacterium]